MSEITNKKCSNTKCKQINPQPITCFSKNRYRKDGLSNSCKPCCKEQLATYQKTPKGKAATARGHKKYQQTEKGKAAQKRWTESVNGKASRARRDKKNRQTLNGKATHAAIAAKYRSAKFQATPKWLTENQNLTTKEIYIHAAELTEESGIEHFVDHILPLQGENISGLHVFWNLQILTQSENNQKFNKFDFTYDNNSWRSE